MFMQVESSCQRAIDSRTFLVRWENSRWQCGGTRGDFPDSAATTRTTAGIWIFRPNELALGEGSLISGQAAKIGITALILRS